MADCGVCDTSPGESPALAVGQADDGDALGRRVLLGGVVEVVLLLLHPGFSGGNPRSHAGSGEGGAPASLASCGLALDVPPARGTSGFR